MTFHFDVLKEISKNTFPTLISSPRFSFCLVLPYQLTYNFPLNKPDCIKRFINKNDLILLCELEGRVKNNLANKSFRSSPDDNDSKNNNKTVCSPIKNLSTTLEILNDSSFTVYIPTELQPSQKLRSFVFYNFWVK